jgi:hypothetical protein
MKAKQTDGAVALCWLSGVVLAVALVVTMYVSRGLDQLGQTSAEIESVARVLDSASGLRLLLMSFSNQCSVAQQNWQGALDIGFGLMFLVCLVGFALIATLAVQLKTNRRLQRRIEQLQKAA